MIRTLVVLVAVSGCSLGFGKAYPGAATRYREFYTCGYVANGWCHDARRDSETGGRGAHGFVGGLRMGVDTGQLGDTGAGGFAVEARVEYAYNLSSWASVGAFGGAGVMAGSVDDAAADGEDTDLGIKRFPVGAQITVAPLSPLLLRAGASMAPSTVKVGDVESSATARSWFAGAGVTVPFPGLHLVFSFEWQRHRTPDVMTTSGPAAYEADTYMFGYWLVL